MAQAIRAIEALLNVVADTSDRRVPEIARACLVALGAQLPTPWGTYVPVEEPSTASLTDPSATPSPIEGIVVTSRHLIGSQLEGTVSAIGSNGLRFLQATLG